MVDTSSDATLSEINSKLEQQTLVPIVTAGAILFVIAIIVILSGVVSVTSESANSEAPLNLPISMLVWVLAVTASVVGGIFAVSKAAASDKKKKTTQLFYQLDEAARSRYETLLKAFTSLAQSARIWSQQTEEATHDFKRHAGANTLITRRPIGVGRLELPGIVTDIPVCGFDFGYMKVFFLPDQLFVFKAKKYGAISYSTIQNNLSELSYREAESVPNDAQIIDYTWRYVNKNGGPDRRFRDNHQIPIVRYGVA